MSIQYLHVHEQVSNNAIINGLLRARRALTDTGISVYTEVTLFSSKQIQ